MSTALKGSLIIGQSGGPSSVINASAYGVIRTALDSDCITKVYGAYHGIKGVLNDELLCMVWPLRKLPLVASMKRAYRNDPIGYGEALRKCVKNICVAKMRTNAFLTTIGQ